MNLQDLRTLLDYHYWARNRLLAAITPLTTTRNPSNEPIFSFVSVILASFGWTDAARLDWRAAFRRGFSGSSVSSLRSARRSPRR